jgi:hypothetical protein
MYTPHPSLVPIEMAAAGMATVTNSYESKDASALAEISTNLVVAEPTVEGVAAALAAAETAADDVRGRAAGSRISWPSSWDEALDESVMAQIEHLLKQ